MLYFDLNLAILHYFASVIVLVGMAFLKKYHVHKSPCMDKQSLSCRCFLTDLDYFLLKGL